MPFHYTIDKNRKLVLTTEVGVFTLVDALAHQEQLRWDPNFVPTYRQLMDLSGVTKIALRPQDLRKLAERPIFAPNTRRAILSPNEDVSGIAEMFASFREGFGDRGIRVFRKLDDALAWIGAAK
ncbi:MAG: hypothetical protein ACHQ49_18190 [Elusimicrobiota bacterium]